MELIYLFIGGSDWEDITVILNIEEAIKKSIAYPNLRVEIFSKTVNNEYIPTYNYYQNGKYIQT